MGSKEQGKDKLHAEVISLITKAENGTDPDQIFAVLMKLQALFTTHSKTNSRELDLVNSIIKKEMRIYYRSPYSKQKKDLVARLNQLLMSL